MSSPFVIIDDTNSSIRYFGPWFEVNTSNTQLDNAIGGPPFQNTLHGVNVSANFSFPFSGSAVLVYGTSITTNASGTQDPTWECFIDNTSIGFSPDPPVNESNWILCSGGPSQFQDGPHLLTVTANVSNHQTFWFDQIQYAPSANVSLNQSLLRIDPSDPAIQYSYGWQSGLQLNSGLNTTFSVNNGSTLTYQFYGTSITWVGDVGYAPNGTVGTLDNSTRATYSVDNQDPIDFLVPIESDPDENYYSSPVIYFETGQLSVGQHQLRVVLTYYLRLYNISESPLALNYFVVQRNASSPTSSNKKFPTSTSFPSSSSSNFSPRKSTDWEFIIIHVGVIGGLVLISLFLALFFFNRRRKKRRAQALNDSEMPNTVPFPDAVNLSTSSSPFLNPTSTFLPQNCTSNGQSLRSHCISSKFTRRGQPLREW